MLSFLYMINKHKVRLKNSYTPQNMDKRGLLNEEGRFIDDERGCL